MANNREVSDKNQSIQTKLKGFIFEKMRLNHVIGTGDWDTLAETNYVKGYDDAMLDVLSYVDKDGKHENE